MQQRYYDPVIGRFYSNDPVGFSASDPMLFNRYAYANNNPYKFTDPDGRVAVLARMIPPPVMPTNTAGPNIPGHPGVPTSSGGFTQAPSMPTLTTSPITAIAVVLIKDALSISSEKPDTLTPGEHAGESIPARGPGRDFTQGERGKINQIGKDTGCHTCGSTEPGTKSGNFVPDHQPPTALNPEGKPQELYPQCIDCSRTQGGQIRAEQIKQQ